MDDNIERLRRKCEEAMHIPKSKAPVGKRFVTEVQRKAFYGELTLNETAESVASSQHESSLDETRLSCDYGKSNSVLRRERMNRLRSLQFVQQPSDPNNPWAPGYNIFKNKCPQFKPNLTATSSEDEDDEENDDPQVAGPSKATSTVESQVYIGGSQGRVGQGCSTPRNCNIALAGLQEWDISAVLSKNTLQKGTSVTPAVARQIKSMSKEPSRPVLNLENSPEVEPMDIDQSQIQNDTIGMLEMFKGSNRKSVAVRPPLSEDLTDKFATFTVDNKSAIRPGGETFTVSGAATGDKESVQHNATYNVNDVHPQEVPSDVVHGETYTIDGGHVEESTALNNKATGAIPVADGPSTSKAEFAVPLLPTRQGKVKLDVREKREAEAANTSVIALQSFSSVVDSLDTTISPGRAMFAPRPAKKVRDMPKTPVRYRKPETRFSAGSNADGERSIHFSDVSGQNSIAEDDSMVDPATDPASRAKDQEIATASAQTQVVDEPVATTSSDLTALSARIATAAPKTPRPVPNYARPTVSSAIRSMRMNNTSTTPAGTPGRLCDSLSSNTTPNTSAPSPFEQIDPSMMVVEAPLRSGVRPRRTLAKFPVLARMNANANGSNTDFESRRRANLERRAQLSINSTVIEPKNDEIDAITEEPSSADTITVSGNHFKSTVECGHDNDSEPVAQVENDAGTVDVPDDLHIEATHQSFADPDDVVADYDGIDDLENHGSPVRCAPEAQQNALLSSSMCSIDTPHRERTRLRIPLDYDETRLQIDRIPSGAEESLDETVDDSTVHNDTERPVYFGANKAVPRSKVMVLQKRKLVKPDVADAANQGLRRSTRTRMKPVRSWLGERALYALSPSGGQRLVGTNDVEIHDPVLIRSRTTDVILANDNNREKQRLRREAKQRRKEYRLKELKKRHKMNLDLDITEESIVTSSDDDEDNS